MTVYASPPHPFFCVICDKPQMTGHWDAYPRANTPIPPLCRMCESLWGRHPHHDLNRDRRVIRQVAALAEVLRATAYCKQNGHEGTYGY